MGRFTGILGLLTMLGLAYAFSTNRRAIRLKTVAWGLGLQIAFALFVLKADIGRRIIGHPYHRVVNRSRSDLSDQIRLGCQFFPDEQRVSIKLVRFLIATGL